MNKLKRFKDETFVTMIPPNYQKVCQSDDDYFDLIRYCWECIGDVKQAISEVKFYDVDAQYEIADYIKSLKHLHIRINECYGYLKELDKTKSKDKIEVYTTTVAHERRWPW